MSLNELPSSCGLSGKKTRGPPSRYPQSKDSWSCWQWTHPSAMDADISQPHSTSWSPASQGISPDRSPGHLSLARQDQRRPALSRRLCLSPKPGAWRAEQGKLFSGRQGLGDSSSWAPRQAQEREGARTRAPLRGRATSAPKMGREGAAHEEQRWVAHLVGRAGSPGGGAEG